MFHRIDICNICKGIVHKLNLFKNLEKIIYPNLDTCVSIRTIVLGFKMLTSLQWSIKSSRKPKSDIQLSNKNKELLSILKFHQNIHDTLGWEQPVPSTSCLLPFSPKIFTYKFITNINTATQPFGQPVVWWVHTASGLNSSASIGGDQSLKWVVNVVFQSVHTGGSTKALTLYPTTHPKHRSLTAPAKSSTCRLLKGDVRHIHHTGFAVEEVCGFERPVCPCRLTLFSLIVSFSSALFPVLSCSIAL